MPAPIGVEIGPPWSTHWFHLKHKLPESWVDQHVDLTFDCNTAEVKYTVVRSYGSVKMGEDEKRENNNWALAAYGGVLDSP